MSVSEGPEATVAGVAGQPVCSAKGCQEPATHLIAWRNPRIHSVDRRKTWTACSVHLGHLTLFLRARAFPVDVEALPQDRP